MENILYYSYNEFETNYNNNFENWRTDYPDATERDFLNEIKILYSPFVRWNGIYHLEIAPIDIQDYDKSEFLKLDQFCTYINNLYKEFLQEEITEDNSELKKEADFKIVIINLICGKNFDRETNFYIDLRVLEQHLYFLECFNYNRNGIITTHILVDKIKLKKFGFSVCKIMTFIDIKLKLLKSENQNLIIVNEVTTPADDAPQKKIISKLTNLQAIGYLFTELINKGLIQADKRNGKLNETGTARMILDHYHFEDLEKQPTLEDIRKTLFESNKLSTDKCDLFKIPALKQLITK